MYDTYKSKSYRMIIQWEKISFVNIVDFCLLCCREDFLCITHNKMADNIC